MPLITATYADLEGAENTTVGVEVSRVQASSQKLAGQMLLSFQGSQWESVAVDVSARDFAAALLRLQTGAWVLALLRQLAFSQVCSLSLDACVAVLCSGQQCQCHTLWHLPRTQVATQAVLLCYYCLCFPIALM
jgi:hypothetical protein